MGSFGEELFHQAGEKKEAVVVQKGHSRFCVVQITYLPVEAGCGGGGRQDLALMGPKIGVAVAIRDEK
ncbi:hypothetical protein IF2G_03161 [Cordyceps javanica]|nr:hypothetical protein IF2G_03161 [Cordyceps javanica]